MWCRITCLVNLESLECVLQDFEVIYILMFKVCVELDFLQHNSSCNMNVLSHSSTYTYTTIWNNQLSPNSITFYFFIHYQPQDWSKMYIYLCSLSLNSLAPQWCGTPYFLREFSFHLSLSKELLSAYWSPSHLLWPVQLKLTYTCSLAELCNSLADWLLKWQNT